MNSLPKVSAHLPIPPRFFKRNDMTRIRVRRPPQTNHEPAHKLFGLYLYNAGANLVGIGTIFILNLTTPISFFKINREIIFDQGGWRLFAVVYPLLMGIICVLQFIIQHPIARTHARLEKGKSAPIHFSQRVKRRLLNLPFSIALLNLVTYIVVSLVVSTAFYFLRGTPVSTCLFVFFRAAMVGLIAAGLSFFLTESYARKRLIPHFFPDGRLFDVPGAIRISILRKIRLLNMAGTLNPMVLLVVTLLFILWQARGSSMTPEQLGREIFLFSLILCLVFAAIALRLNGLVSDSILKPIAEMLAMVKRVKGGDFSQRIRVVSNDEIGVLADAGNEMIRGLAERERMRDTFGKYVTPEIRDEILAGRIPLDGIRAEATLLFSDLRSFTHYVERNDPEEVIDSMRAYFTAMEEAIRNHNGLVLQYVGDEIEAVFGIPISDRFHADNALFAALEMRKRLEDLNHTRESAGRTPFRHGVGICTGNVLAGNTGSENRLSYALIGDTVNLASRIQELTKRFHCDILASQETVRNLSHPFKLEEMSPQSVRGYSKSIRVCQVLGSE